MLALPEDSGFRIPSQVSFLLFGSVAGITALCEDGLNILEKIDGARGGRWKRSNFSTVSA